MMNKKYLIALIVFVVFCVFLPFIVELLYRIGKTHPIIVTSYAQEDILSYIASVFGLSISMVAIFIAKSDKIPKFDIEYSRTFDDSDCEAVIIQLFNESDFDCDIMIFGFVNKYGKKENRYHCHIASNLKINAMGRCELIFDAKTLRKKYESVKKQSLNGKVYYEISLGFKDRKYILDIKDLEMYI